MDARASKCLQECATRARIGDAAESPAERVPGRPLWRAAGPEAAHTWNMFDTDAVFHAPMFALKADAP